MVQLQSHHGYKVGEFVLVVDPDDFQENVKIHAIIRRPDGSIVVRVEDIDGVRYGIDPDAIIRRQYKQAWPEVA